MKQLLVVGLGLMGCSAAAAARRQGYAVTGIDSQAERNAAALALGLVDQVATDIGAGVAGADLVLVAVPPAVAVDLLAQVFQAGVGPQVPVMDITSVKAQILEGLQQILGQLPAQFVPAHPMTGSHRQGPAAANAELFQGSLVFLTPVATTDPALLAQGAAFWRSLGASVQQVDALRHDAMVAATSHLPHLLAAGFMGYLAAKAEPALADFAGSGLRDFSRIAGGDPELWAQIFAGNQAALVTELDAWLAHLTRLRGLVAQQNWQGVRQQLYQARDFRARLVAHLPQWQQGAAEDAE